MAAPFRGGALAPFPVRPIASIAGTVFVEDGGSRLVPAFGELSVEVEGKRIASPIGKNGEFYLDRVPAGRREAVIEDAFGTCRFHLDVAVARTGIQQLGALACVREKESRP